MRVLLVAPYPPKRDGLATYTRDVAHALAPLTHVRVAAQAPGDSRGDGPEVCRVLSASPLSIRRLVRTVRDIGPDVVHVQFTVPAYGIQLLWILVGLALVRRRSDAATVWSLHEVSREIALLGPLARALFRAIARMSEVIVVHSEDARARLVEACGLAAAAVIHLPHGVFTDAAPDRTAGSGAPEGPVAFFGFLHPDKGVEHLVDGVAAAGERARLVIGGSVRPRRGAFRVFERRDHRYEAELHRRVDRHGIAERVTFAGYLSDDELTALLHDARLVVFPYLDVTQSGAVNRAVAAGCPVVASDLPGLRDDLPAEAVLVPPGDGTALGAAIADLLADDARRERMSAAALSLAARRSSVRTAEALIEIYERAGAVRTAGSAS